MGRQPTDGEGGPKRTELLCTVRGILKKIKQSVLVGDRVRVAGIDWDDRRGAHESCVPVLRGTEPTCLFGAHSTVTNLRVQNYVIKCVHAM